MGLLAHFKYDHPGLNVRAVLADALYGTGAFLDQAAALFDRAQVISQLRSNQKVGRGREETSLEDFFARQASTEADLEIRGTQKRRISFARAHLYVRAHGKRRVVIALKYEGETPYRYLVA